MENVDVEKLVKEGEDHRYEDQHSLFAFLTPRFQIGKKVLTFLLVPCYRKLVYGGKLANESFVHIDVPHGRSKRNYAVDDADCNFVSHIPHDEINAEKENDAYCKRDHKTEIEARKRGFE